MSLRPNGDDEHAAREEQAVLLEWEDGEPPLTFLFQAEDELSAILEPTGLGEVDGDDVGSGSATIYLYGADCEALWRAIESTVRGFNPSPTKVTIRPGGPDTPKRDVVLRS